MGSGFTLASWVHVRSSCTPSLHQDIAWTPLARPTQDGPCIYCMIRQANERRCEDARTHARSKSCYLLHMKRAASGSTRRANTTSRYYIQYSTSVIHVGTARLGKPVCLDIRCQSPPFYAQYTENGLGCNCSRTLCVGASDARCKTASGEGEIVASLKMHPCGRADLGIEDPQRCVLVHGRRGLFGASSRRG